MSFPEAAALADALDGLDAGLFLVGQGGRIVHANASGKAILGERTVLRTAGGRLIACEANAARALRNAFAMAGGAAAGAAGIAVPLSARDGAHYIAYLLPLISGVRRLTSEYAAVAALFVHKAVPTVAFPREAIAKLYHLTPGELRVLFSIVEVGGVPETAQALGIAEATVRTHLHRLFRKTGATRQAELIKLVTAYSNPLVAQFKRPPLQERRQPIHRRDAALPPDSAAVAA